MPRRGCLPTGTAPLRETLGEGVIQRRTQYLNSHIEQDEWAIKGVTSPCEGSAVSMGGTLLHGP